MFKYFACEFQNCDSINFPFFFEIWTSVFYIPYFDVYSLICSGDACFGTCNVPSERHHLPYSTGSKVGFKCPNCYTCVVLSVLFGFHSAQTHVVKFLVDDFNDQSEVDLSLHRYSIFYCRELGRGLVQQSMCAGNLVVFCRWYLFGHIWKCQAIRTRFSAAKRLPRY
jgi:hypothetical protein